MPLIKLEVIDLQGKIHQIQVLKGANLRAVLREKGWSPYVPLTEKRNCGGRGLCATCGVWITEDAPAPRQWHDRAAQRFGYPRLSCQVQIEAPMQVTLAVKKIWGKRKKKKS